LLADGVRVHLVFRNEVFDEIDSLGVQSHDDAGGLCLPSEFSSMTLLVDHRENLCDAMGRDID
jgi:hypothetical protein